MTDQEVQLFLVDLAIIILLARLLGIAAKRLGQPPVLGEIIAGILLGPTLFGGQITATLFPAALRPPLSALASLGVVMFMFAVGYQLDLRLFRGRERVAASVSVSSVILPLSLGIGLGAWLASRHHVHHVLPFALFVGTAIPVIVVSLLDERGRGFALGAAEYLVKPVAKEQLLAAIYRAAAVPERKHTVVAIDDDPLAIELARVNLEPAGWTVLGAASGQEGLALIRERQPSVVLLDLLMPGMDGFEVVEALRAEPDTKTIPVVILTSKSMTRQDKERLQGRITYVARKTEFDLSGLAGLLRWASTDRQSAAPEPG